MESKEEDLRTGWKAGTLARGVGWRVRVLRIILGLEETQNLASLQAGTLRRGFGLALLGGK